MDVQMNNSTDTCDNSATTPSNESKPSNLSSVSFDDAGYKDPTAYQSAYYSNGDGSSVFKHVESQQDSYINKMDTSNASGCLDQSQSFDNAATSRKRKLEDGDDDGEEIPRGLNIIEFASSRADEMLSLQRAVDTKNKSNPTQQVPFYMRRRAACHNIKRLPRRLRERARKEVERADKSSKRPSRYHRRRPKNLLAEYTRRQRQHVWLETHIWHAKRFKIVEKWGYKIPLHPNDKSTRAAYRATARYATLNDISYHGCIEFIGPKESIIGGLSRMTSTDIGLTFAAQVFLSGTQQGKVVLYEHDKYPYKAIGPVMFLWKPVNNCDGSVESSRQLWIWVHPSYFAKVFEEFKFIYNMNEHSGASQCEKKSDELPGVKSIPEFLQNIICSNGTVTMKSLKDNLLRFRLTGPMVTNVLKDALKVASVITNNDEVQHEKVESKWWQRYFNNKLAYDTHQNQADVWNSSLGGVLPRNFPRNGLLGLVVRDPRVFLPGKRTKLDASSPGAFEDSSEQSQDPQSISFDRNVSLSPIWDQSVRDEVKFTKLTEAEMNRKRGELLVPGSEPDLGEDESRIPILLIHNSDSSVGNPFMSDFGRGWDLIIPAGWGMAFWVALVYRQARVGGLREIESMQYEQSEHRVPQDYPDTEAGKTAEDEKKKLLEEKYKKYPPAKRPNYTKLGTVAPFHCPWKELLNEWQKILKREQAIAMVHEVKDFIVMRSRKTLCWISELCCSQSTVKDIKDGEKEVNISDLDSEKDMNQLQTDYPNSIVSVNLKIVKRGVPEEFGMICIPEEEDLEKLEQDSKYGGPIEPIHKNHSEKKNRKSETEKKKKKIKQISNINAPEQEVLVYENVVQTSSRKVIGYIKNGGFSFGRAQGHGQGFCALTGLLTLLKRKPAHQPTIVLIRSVNSLQYRFSYLSVNL